MEPTIKENSLIFGIRVFGEMHRGDIVVFVHDGRQLVKRIAGVPGDKVYAGGQALTVPAGCYFVLGDNSEDSVDSRYWDNPFVPRENITAVLPR